MERACVHNSCGVAWWICHSVNNQEGACFQLFDFTAEARIEEFSARLTTQSKQTYHSKQREGYSTCNHHHLREILAATDNADRCQCNSIPNPPPPRAMNLYSRYQITSISSPYYLDFEQFYKLSCNNLSDITLFWQCTYVA